MIHVSITQADIDQGIRSDYRRCPTALACTRAFGKPCIVGAFKVKVYANEDDRRKRDEPEQTFDQPGILFDFWFAFDAECPVSPIEFTLE